MIWKMIFCVLLVKPIINKITSVQNTNKELNQLRKTGGFDERQNADNNCIFDVAANIYKQKILKQLERKDVSIPDKLEIIHKNKWLLDKQSEFCVNLLAGDLIDSW